VQEPPFESQETLYTNADFYSEVFTWYADGTPVDFTGCTGQLAFRVSPDDAAPAFEATSVTLTNAGQASYMVAKTALVGVTAPVVHGDLLLTMSDGRVIEFAHIDLTIVQGSTY
jgi:hypothetical protein